MQLITPETKFFSDFLEKPLRNFVSVILIVENNLLPWQLTEGCANKSSLESASSDLSAGGAGCLYYSITQVSRAPQERHIAIHMSLLRGSGYG
jgi:hypothetical protein